MLLQKQALWKQKQLEKKQLTKGNHRLVLIIIFINLIQFVHFALLFMFHYYEFTWVQLLSKGSISKVEVHILKMANI